MTRGKYAAKANGQRAEAAATTASTLRTQLDTERREHADATAALKAQIGSLEGRLLREVRELAAEEVERVRVEHRAALEAERADRRRAALEIADFLYQEGLLSGLNQDRAGQLSDLLGLERHELLVRDANREGRRITKKKMRYADSLIRGGRSVGDLQGGVGTPGIGARNGVVSKTFTVGGGPDAAHV